MSSLNENIKITLAKKLVDSLSLKDISEEEFFEAMKNIFSNITDNKEELDFFIESYKETYSFSFLLEKMSEIYAKNFTEDEMLDLINFFTTSTGKIWVKKQQSILTEIIEVSEEYGASLVDDIIKKTAKE